MVLDEDVETGFLLSINNCNNGIMYVWLEPILFKNKIEARDAVVCIFLCVYALQHRSKGGCSVQAAIQLDGVILLSSLSSVSAPLSDSRRTLTVAK